MSLPAITNSTWVQVHTAGTGEWLQVFGGRIRLADSAAPATDDYMVLPAGAIIDVYANKWAQKIDAAAWVQMSAL